MVTTLVFEDQFELPLNVNSFAEFRHWVASPEFPERGRIDFIGQNIEIDMAAEELFTHGTPKGEIYATLYLRVKRGKLGHIFVDRTRISNVDAELSSEPDIVFVSRDSLDSGRVTLRPKASGEEGRFIELEGSPDLIVEIVSDTSERKDTVRLPAACFKAGVLEYWLVDARKSDRLKFQIHHRGQAEYELTQPDEEGYQPSEVLNCRFRLDRTMGDDGHWEFDLRLQENS